MNVPFLYLLSWCSTPSELASPRHLKHGCLAMWFRPNHSWQLLCLTMLCRVFGCAVVGSARPAVLASSAQWKGSQACHAAMVARSPLTFGCSVLNLLCKARQHTTSTQHSPKLTDFMSSAYTLYVSCQVGKTVDAK